VVRVRTAVVVGAQLIDAKALKALIRAAVVQNKSKGR